MNAPSVRSGVRIEDVSADRPDRIDAAATLLHEAFAGRTADWQSVESARREVLESLEPEKISRVAVAPSGEVVGWIGAIPEYNGHVWEIHPLVVAPSSRRQGIGRALIADLEAIASARGVSTLIAGSDDEHGETSLSGVDLYVDVPAAIRGIRNVANHPFEFYVRVGFTVVGVLPDANGPGKPDIVLAKPVARRG